MFDECNRHGCPPPKLEVNAGDLVDIQMRIDAAPDALLGILSNDSIAHEGYDDEVECVLISGRPEGADRPTGKPKSSCACEPVDLQKA